MLLSLFARPRFGIGRCLQECSNSLHPPSLSLRLRITTDRRLDCGYSSVAMALQDLVTTGRLKPDETQRFAAKVLNALQTSIRQSGQEDRHHQAPSGHQADLSNSKDQPSDTSRAQQAPPALPFPRGAYLWGTIGSGKTMLLDLFCSSFSEADQQHFGLSRLHFHEFMLKIHNRWHRLQESLPRIRGQSQFGLPVYRQGLTSRTHLVINESSSYVASQTFTVCLGMHR